MHPAELDVAQYFTFDLFRDFSSGQWHKPNTNGGLRNAAGISVDRKK